MKKLLYIFGTRPEAIKLAPLILETQQDPKIRTIVCSTGQHLEMLDQALDFFGIKPDHSLKVMSKNQTLSSLTSKIISKLEKIIDEEQPDIIIVHGDTTSSFCGAIAAYYKQIKIAHVEAGLRTGDKFSPWPEEGNRKIVASISDMHFAPTQNAFNALVKEGVPKHNIKITGNTVIDAIKLASININKSDNLLSQMKAKFSFLDNNKKIILVTGHRRESFGDGFKNICNAIKRVAIANKDVQICYPVHLNPNVQGPVHELLLNYDNIFLIEPQNYQSFVYLMQISYIILTDSGGIQEEAPSLGKPVLVMRDKTERPEAISSGIAKLVGSDEDLIFNSVEELLSNPQEYKKFALSKNPYGDGKASKYIKEYLSSL